MTAPEATEAASAPNAISSTAAAAIMIIHERTDRSLIHSETDHPALGDGQACSDRAGGPGAGTPGSAAGDRRLGDADTVAGEFVDDAHQAALLSVIEAVEERSRRRRARCSRSRPG